MKRTSLIAVVVAWVSFAVPAQAEPALPKSIASIGDSITRAANVCCYYGDHASRSWSTGGYTGDTTRSHYERILALQPAILGRNYNDARSGARMAEAPTQAARAVSQGAHYVTILMGANDVCTSSPSNMTSTTSFRSSFEAAMRTLDTGLPRRSKVFVSSIPNIYQLWQVLHGNWLARSVWETVGICQSMLDGGRTEAQRQDVLAREQAFNRILQEVCARYARCKFDGYAVYNFQFTADMVSKLDYFHPSTAGQTMLARVTWQSSWWGST
jgi:lysophospholipase L1-like esterase